MGGAPHQASISHALPSAPGWGMDAADVRRALRDAILELGEWTESPTVFGPGSDPSSLAHRSFGVLLEAEENLQIYRDRKAEWCRARQRAVIRYAYRLRPNAIGDQWMDLDDAIEAGHSIVRRLLNFEGAHNRGLALRYERSSRTIADSGKWVLVDLEFSVDHNVSLG